VTVEPPSWGKLTKSLAIKCINSICSRLHRIFFIFYDGLFLLSELIGILKVEPLIARTMQVGILLMRLINFGFLHYRHGCSCSGCPIPPFFCILFLLVSSAECLVSDGVFYDAFRSRILIFMWESLASRRFGVFSWRLFTICQRRPTCRIYELNCLFYDCSSFA